ncbi:acyl-CoA synthetase [Nocardia sp. 348MFTsu5.1]|uniref:acyl-CoA synthetase n=1 Tax=Nocardia sp. 348MFTsu5.1 TaxID=1172185 RepID=UPI00035DAD61|nr:acyl-CoA synthetase [Nocardia sp. 348MFTsu5.1]
MTEWSIGDVLDEVASAVPDREMTVCGGRRSTFAESAVRTRRLASFLVDQGLGVNTPQSEHERWECGQDRVALIMRNDLFPDAMIACLKARVVPVNVNYNYTAREIAELLDYVRPRAVMYHRSFGPEFAAALTAEGIELLIEVDDGSDVPSIEGSVSFDDAVAQGDPDRALPSSPDDMIMQCTGGTTGRPKGVLWRQSDLYVSSLAGNDYESATDLHNIALTGGQVWFAMSPLVHAAGIWTAFSGLLTGQTVVLFDDRERFDARSVLETAEREKVSLMTMVGDAYAAPIVAELRRTTYDLSSMYAIGTGGAATNPIHKTALLECLPNVTVIDGYGSSETGGLGFYTSQKGALGETFGLRPGGTVVSADRSRILEPGDDEIGWTARIGRVPLGYFRDQAASEATFPVVGGERMSIPGDRATLDADGTVRLLGRDSLVVNTGGEKVFVEEVEAVIRRQPGITDALVLGRASDRWGQEVVALVALDPGSEETEESLRSLCKSELAGFKAPKAVIFVEQVGRLGNGKPDYRWAKAAIESYAADAAVPATSSH